MFPKFKLGQFANTCIAMVTTHGRYAKKLKNIIINYALSGFRHARGNVPSYTSTLHIEKPSFVGALNIEDC